MPWHENVCPRRSIRAADFTIYLTRYNTREHFEKMKKGKGGWVDRRVVDVCFAGHISRSICDDNDDDEGMQKENGGKKGKGWKTKLNIFNFATDAGWLPFAWTMPSSTMSRKYWEAHRINIIFQSLTEQWLGICFIFYMYIYSYILIY